MLFSPQILVRRPPKPVVAAGGGPVAITQTDHGESTTDASSYTFSARSIGTAASDRRVIIGLSMRVAGTTTTVSSVTVDGQSATAVVTAADNTGGNTTLSALYVSANPTNTTGDVVVTFSGTVLRCGVNVWRMVGASSGTASATGSSVVDPATTTFTIPANGSAVGYVAADFTGTPAVSWTNITSSLAVTVIEGSFNHAGAMADFVSGGSTALTGDYSGGTIGPQAGVFATWGP